MPPNNAEASFNTDELEAPAFLNKELFAKVLKKCENSENLVLKNVKLTPASQKGDHYASIMFRANVEYDLEGEVHHKSLVIKTMPFVEGHKMEMLQDSYVFETEIGMYTEVLPKFEDILRDIGEEAVLAAPVLYHSLDPHKVIIFEDLLPQGYSVLRSRHLNEEEVKAAYTKLAEWHAVSYKLALEQPEYFDKYRHGLWTWKSLFKNDFLLNGVKLFVEMLHRQPALSEYVPYFEALQEDLLQRVAREVNQYRENPQAGSYYVLCHGDFHNKNMMLKNNAETGQFEDVMLLDFQLSFMGPIVYDLMYSYYMLLNAELRAKFDEFFNFYYNIFSTIIKKLEFKGTVPKLEELRKQWLDNKSHELFLMTIFLPMWQAMRDGIGEPDEMRKSADHRRKLYENEEYIKEVHTLLPKFLQLGYFDT